uniref:protein cornichon homolog 4-like isoform X1 n=1 Tax=Oncorhynchus gorbuscha TaxID=8017 RepID=UPI001EAE94F0|nr:protein cornichon homolog 4-like isoform X1 [Oncorhynchus gorbuscha]
MAEHPANKARYPTLLPTPQSREAACGQNECNHFYKDKRLLPGQPGELNRTPSIGFFFFFTQQGVTLINCTWVVPELVGQALATVLMLVSLHWFVFLLNLPVATWNMYRVWKVPMGNMGVFDPTEIHNRGQLKSHMKESMIKLGFHLLCFFIYLYSMILALIND